MSRLSIKPEWIKTINGIHSLIWAVLIVPSLLWWKHSVPWIVFMSVWANFATAISTWMGSRAEVEAKNTS